jgi:hypothetical protein
VPALGLQRSPGHFFDLAPFSLSCLFGLALVGIERTIRRRSAARVVIAALAVLMVVDFWPGTAIYRGGTPADELRQIEAIVRPLPGEGGTLRLTLLPGYRTLLSLAVMSTDAGGAWSWLPWQAGARWPSYLATAGGILILEGDLARAERPVQDALRAIGRIKYLLLGVEPQVTPPRPWKLRARSGRYSVWEQPRVLPMAVGYRSYLLLVGAPEITPRLVGEVFRRNVLVVSGGERLSETPAAVVAGAAMVRCEGETALADDASRALLAQHPSTVPDPSRGSPRQWAAYWEAFAARWPVTPLVPVRYARPAPEHMVLEIDAGPAPAMVFVSESHHPWWQARVDGQPAPVLRVQDTFLGVPVGPGAHEIEVRFRPPLAVVAADAVTAGAWGLLVLAIPLGALARRRHGTGGVG